MTSTAEIQIQSGLVAANPSEQNAYMKGYLAAMEAMKKPSEDFFEELAESLRNLWPPGEKDGKYPWRDSVQNLKKRLHFLWEDRKLDNRYTISECLSTARRYLAQYETSVKYMQTLKYFIFKQNKLVGKDGKITYTYKSTFADMLESAPVDSTDWDELFETTNSYSEGTLI